MAYVFIVLLLFIAVREWVAWANRGLLCIYKGAVGLDPDTPHDQFLYRLFDLHRLDSGMEPGPLTCTVEVHLMEEE